MLPLFPELLLCCQILFQTTLHLRGGLVLKVKLWRSGVFTPGVQLRKPRGPQGGRVTCPTKHARPTPGRGCACASGFLVTSSSRGNALSLQGHPEGVLI